MANANLDAYPASLEIAYPEEPRNRLTTFFRLFTVIPIMILYEVLVYSTSTIILPTLLMILFRRKYPRW
ncbi:MAG: hypothetical protein DK306_001699 [Chloroflexi bacterium]|jgi:hypothetical protein|nr:MAG: hypothetical protein DK306_001699 [Chloroflexota bacterium]